MDGQVKCGIPIHRSTFNCHKGVLKIVTTKDPLKEANHKGPHILLFYLY